MCGSATHAAAEGAGALPLADLERRAAADPDDGERAYELALAYHAAHDLPQALEWYRTAQTLDPTNELIRTSLHTALTERGLLEDSLAEFHTNFAQVRAQPAAAFNFALVAERQGLVEEAIFHYQRYLAMAPHATDGPSIAARVQAMQQSIAHRQVRIRQLTTRPGTVKPGRPATVNFSYQVRGWGKHNYTGVLEQVSLYRDDVETHRFAQRSIRRDGKRYTARLEILIPPDAAPGPYTLVAQVVAGSRRDDQITVFTIAPPPLEERAPVTVEMLPVEPDVPVSLVLPAPAASSERHPLVPPETPAILEPSPAVDPRSIAPAPASEPAEQPATSTPVTTKREPYPEDDPALTD